MTMKRILCFGLFLAFLIGPAGIVFPAWAETAPSKAITTKTTLTLEKALSRVLTKSPFLQAADSAWKASDARIEQAGRRPNPELELELEEFAGTGEMRGFGSSGMNIFLSQSLERGGKRGLRRDFALGKTRLADWDRRALRLDLICHTKEAFMAVWVAQSLFDLATEQRDLFNELKSETLRRVNAGAESPVQLSRIQAGLAAAEMDCRSKKQQLLAACNSLSVLWDSSEPDFTAVSGEFETMTTTTFPANPDELISGNPDLELWRVQQALQEVSLDLARSDNTTDLDIGLGIKRSNETGDQAFVIGAGFPIPVFGRNEGEIRAAEYELEQTSKQREAIKVTLVNELTLAHQDRMAALDEVQTLNLEIIPLASEAFEATLTGHQKGLFSFTDVLETRHFLFELRESYIHAIARHHLATARIDRLVGSDQPGMATSSTEDSK